MFVFGGRADRFGPFHSNNEIYCNKIKVFDTETNSWLNTPTNQIQPEGRRSHSACEYTHLMYIQRSVCSSYMAVFNVVSMVTFNTMTLPL